MYTIRIVKTSIVSVISALFFNMYVSVKGFSSFKFHLLSEGKIHTAMKLIACLHWMSRLRKLGALTPLQHCPNDVHRDRFTFHRLAHINVRVCVGKGVWLLGDKRCGSESRISLGVYEWVETTLLSIHTFTECMGALTFFNFTFMLRDVTPNNLQTRNDVSDKPPTSIFRVKDWVSGSAITVSACLPIYTMLHSTRV